MPNPALYLCMLREDCPEPVHDDDPAAVCYFCDGSVVIDLRARELAIHVAATEGNGAWLHICNRCFESNFGA